MAGRRRRIQAATARSCRRSGRSGRRPSVKNQVQLIAYVDRLSAGGFRELERLLSGRLAGVFGGAHLLPFFTPIDGADAGFDPSDHTEVDARLGTWDDVKALGDTVELVSDLIVNHASSSSPQFVDWSTSGAASAYAGMFLTYDRVFPDGRDRSRAARDLPPASLASLHADDAGVRREAAAVDHVHAATGRYRRAPSRGGRLPRVDPASVRGVRHSHDPPRCRRVRDQESRHQLFHDSRDVRVHRRTLGAGASAGDGSAGRNPQPLPAADRDREAGRLGLRLRAAAARAPRALRVRCGAAGAMACDQSAQRRHRPRHARWDRRHRRGR